MDMTLHKIMDLLWKRNINEIDFCEAVGINKSAVTDWKKGKTQSYKRYLRKIADYLDVPIEYFSDKVDNVTPFPNEKINLSEIDYALLGETKELDNEEKQELLRMAKRMRELQELKKNK